MTMPPNHGDFNRGIVSSTAPTFSTLMRFSKTSGAVCSASAPCVGAFVCISKKYGSVGGRFSS